MKNILPLTEPTADPAKEPAPRHLHRQDRTSQDPRVIKPRKLPSILLVDDDPTFGALMQRLVNLEGGSISICHDMEELGAEMQGKYDVAILDYDLGSVTGVELSNYLEQWFPHMPIVLVSQTRTADISQKSGQVRSFVHKALGPYAILDAAFEAHDISLIYADMRRSSTVKH